jgi:phosphoribosyl-ATP pyrophosphohydrolase/phosphoribosyl-AMP cyclohydrolase/histidinol dehydrogenase
VPRLSRYGALFLGAGSAEVLGDYGAGPNHVLPTGGTARIASGLSALTFLRVRTWLATDGAAAQDLARDAARFARLEGLEAHGRAADRRVGGV